LHRKTYVTTMRLYLRAVKNNGHSLRFASEDLKNNYEIVFEAVKFSGKCLKYATKRLHQNNTLIFTALLKEKNIGVESGNRYLELEVDNHLMKFNYFKCLVDHIGFEFFKFFEFDFFFIYNFKNQKRKCE
jgi:hypothetical protein